MKHFSSPLLLGPEPSEKLPALILHLFTEEEADLVQHLHPLRPRSAAKIAKSSGRSLEETDLLSLTKRVVLSYGTPRKYTLLPVVPGTFEMVLMTPDTATQNEWHRRFSVLFEDIWEEGYIAEYTSKAIPGIRYLPVDGPEVALPGGNSACSCCGCCCHAMQSITRFNTPGLISPPRFPPEADDSRCISCETCVKTCPMGALSLKGEKSS